MPLNQSVIFLQSYVAQLIKLHITIGGVKRCGRIAEVGVVAYRGHEGSILGVGAIRM